MSSDKDPQKIKSMFGEISSYYDFVNNVMSFGTHYLLKYMAVRAHDIKPRSNVLDVCCGTGDFVKIIRKMYPRVKVMGLDFSPEMIKHAQNKHANGTYIVVYYIDLPFGKFEFDYVL